MRLRRKEREIVLQRRDIFQIRHLLFCMPDWPWILLYCRYKSNHTTYESNHRARNNFFVSLNIHYIENISHTNFMTIMDGSYGKAG